MTLAWSSIPPGGPGVYFAAYPGSEQFTLIDVLPDGKANDRNTKEIGPILLSNFDLFSWPVTFGPDDQPVEVPPAPVREPLNPPAAQPAQPAKDTPDGSDAPSQIS